MTRRKRGAGALSFVVGAITGLASASLFGRRSSGRNTPDPFGPDVGRGTTHSPVSAASLAGGFEQQDANAFGIGWIMALFAAFAVTGVSVMVVLVNSWHHQDAARQSGLTSEQRTQSDPPAPRLQADPISEIDALKARELSKLNGYARLDANTARIPIGRAMALVTGQSLDAHAAPARKP